ncbi:MAG: hypothetical protein M3186_06435 [Actinomycetota bacterium]|nr:hypothetical protein [Actinomycetota bacterium]
MAAAETVPEVHQPVSPAGSDALEGEPLGKRPRITVAAVLAFVIAIAANLALIAMLASRDDPASMVSAQAQQQASPALPVAPPSLPTTFGEGKFVVGTDISPGTYQTPGPADAQYCYWERFKDPSGAADSIIANHVGRGPATVTIDAGDGAFNTRWCGTWTKVN